MALESIAFIPSGYKANKLYCQLPVDGGADLTTSRASGATRVNKNGLIEDVATGIPRLDYTNGGCPELLLEPQSTNYVDYSEDFSNGAWIINNGGVSPTITGTAFGKDVWTLTDNGTNLGFYNNISCLPWAKHRFPAHRTGQDGSNHPVHGPESSYRNAWPASFPSAATTNLPGIWPCSATRPGSGPCPCLYSDRTSFCWAGSRCRRCGWIRTE